MIYLIQSRYIKVEGFNGTALDTPAFHVRKYARALCSDEPVLQMDVQRTDCLQPCLSLNTYISKTIIDALEWSHKRHDHFSYIR